MRVKKRQPHTQLDNKLQKQQTDRSQFQQQAEAEEAKEICLEESESMTEKDVEKEMKIEQEKTRIQGEEFEKW